MTSRDYERALRALDNITNPDETVRAAAEFFIQPRCGTVPEQRN